MSETANAIRTTRRNLKIMEKTISTQTQELAQIKAEKVKLESALEATLAEESKKQLDEQIAKATFGFIQRLTELGALVDELEDEKQEQLNHYSRDAISQVVHEQVADDSIYGRLSEVKELLIDSMGASLYKRTLAGLPVITVSPNSYVRAMRELSEIQSIPRLRRFSELIANTSVRIADIDILSNGGTTTMIVFGLLSLILMILFSPVWLVSCVALATRNLIVTAKIRRMLYVYTICMDNYREREKAIEELVDKLYEDTVADLEKEYAEAQSRVEQEMSKQESLKNEARDKVNAEFVFDDVEIRERLNSQIQHLTDNLLSIEKQNAKDMAELLRLQRLLGELDIKMDEEAKDICKKYVDLDTVGSSKMYPTEFLVTFRRPLRLLDAVDNSLMFAFRDYMLAEDLGRLFCAQIRTMTAPGTVQIQVWDSKKSGVRFLSFAGVNDKKGRGDELVFQIHSNTSAFREKLDELDELLQRRLRVIQSAYPNILSYNKDMIDLGSVPESYILILVYYPESLLGDERFYRLLTNGPDLGVYTYVFCDEELLSDAYFQLFDAVGQNYNVLPDYPQTIAASSLRTAVLAKKDKESQSSLLEQTT